MKTNRIIKILMDRDGMTKEEAENLYNEALEDMYTRLAEGEMPEDICEEWFGLEPDYLDDMIF